MAKLTINDASRACGVSRTTVQRAVKAGRLSLDAEHQVDTAELLRLGYKLDAALLHAASQQGKVHAQRDAAAQGRSSVQEGAAGAAITDATGPDAAAPDTGAADAAGRAADVACSTAAL